MKTNTPPSQAEKKKEKKAILFFAYFERNGIPDFNWSASNLNKKETIRLASVAKKVAKLINDFNKSL